MDAIACGADDTVLGTRGIPKMNPNRAPILMNAAPTRALFDTTAPASVRDLISGIEGVKRDA